MLLPAIAADEAAEDAGVFIAAPRAGAGLAAELLVVASGASVADAVPLGVVTMPGDAGGSRLFDEVTGGKSALVTSLVCPAQPSANQAATSGAENDDFTRTS